MHQSVKTKWANEQRHSPISVHLTMQNFAQTMVTVLSASSPSLMHPTLEQKKPILKHSRHSGEGAQTPYNRYSTISEHRLQNALASSLSNPQPEQPLCLPTSTTTYNNNNHQDDPFTTPQNTPHKNTNNTNTNITNTNNSNTNSSNNSNRSSNRSVNNLRARSNVGNFGSSVKKKRNGISKGDRFLRTTQRLSKNNSSNNNSSSNHNVGDSSKKAKRERLKIRKFFKKIKKL